MLKVICCKLLPAASLRCLHLDKQLDNNFDHLWMFLTRRSGIRTLQTLESIFGLYKSHKIAYAVGLTVVPY